MSDAGASLIGRLEEASKKHEVTVVVELGVDRMVKWMGVYLLLALGVLTKIAETASSNLYCFPSNVSVEVSGELTSFSNAFCWEAPTHNSSCSQDGYESISLLENSDLLKFFVQFLPYYLLIQALMFSVPSIYWHFRIGSRLLGHLKFMQLMLEVIFTELKHIVKVFYNKEPYDKRSENFDGRLPYASERKKQQAQSSDDHQAVENKSTKQATTIEMTVVIEDESKQLIDSEKGIPLQTLSSQPGKVANINQASNVAVEQKYTDQSSFKQNNSSDLELSWFASKLVGKLRDRHFFSMLCYENFANLHHLPYILSVFKLTRSLKAPCEPEAAKYDLNEGIIYLWCHDDNLDNILLVKKYFKKHIATAVLAAIMLALMTWFLLRFSSDVASSETFRCHLPARDICMLCTVCGTRDVFAVFICDYIITALIMILSLANWLLMRRSSDKAACHFFDQMKETSNIALKLAHEWKKKKNN